MGDPIRAAIAAAINPEHQGEDRQILHVFYDACMSEGGSVDEIHLRGLRAVLARWGRQPTLSADDIPPGPFSEHELREQWNQQADEFNQWDLLDSYEQLAWAQARAIQRDRNVRPTPPPAEGEVAELVGWLHANSSGIYRPAARAAELLQQQQAEIQKLWTWLLACEGSANARAGGSSKPKWPAHAVPVSERLPEPNTKVLAHYFNALGNGRTICAIWVPAKSRSDDAADDDFTEYDEENDKYYWPEGWYEAIENWDDLGWVAVNEGEVAYWQPLPRWPALPMPQGEVQP